LGVLRLLATMTVSALLLLFAAVVSVAFGTNEGNNQAPVASRLIAFNETYQVWMTQEEIETLIFAKTKFMDITEYPKVSQVAPKASRLSIPNQPQYKAYVDSLLPSLSSNQLVDTITQLSLFNTRYYTSATGVSAATWIFDSFTKFAGGRSDITIERWTHTWAQPSIIARIRGQGPNSDEVVVIGAHEDSVGTSSTARAPGADDDASGTATVLEAFRVLVLSGFIPDRTLEFHTYAAEEAGLLGSQNIANTYSTRGTVVAAMLQLDMTGYGSAPVGIITDFTHGNLTAFLRILVDTYTLITWTDSRCGYGCSDHASWNRAGYPSAFPFEAPFGSHSPYIHTANDVIGTLNFAKAIEFAKIAVGFAVELAGVGGLATPKA